MKLAVIASHPIQYHAPLYRLLAKQIDLRVFFANIPTPVQQGMGFGVPFSWDVPLTDGYNHAVFAQNLFKTSDLPGLLSAAKRLGASFTDWNPDAILLTGWHHAGMLAGWIAAHRSGKPLLFRGENNLLTKRPWWKIAIHRAMLSQVSKILFVGELNRRYYEILGFSSEQLGFCPFFSDSQRIAQDAQRLRHARKKIRDGWGIPDDEVCFLFCGKLEAKKRPLDFIHAIEATPKACGLVVGAGELEAELRRHSSKIHFAGFLNQSEIAAGYVAADALVLPSDQCEVWGLVVNEAMACEVPCIVSAQVGCGEDLIIDGQTGFSYPCGEVDELTNRMIRMMADADGRQQMGIRARERVDRIYNVETAAAALLKALQACIEG